MMLRQLLLLALLFSISVFSFAKDKDITSFDQGVKYFKDKDYKSALKHFKKARSLGMKSNVLTFNIAATYYRLGSYKSAEKNFRRLTNEKNFKQIAFYNLGLIAEKRKTKQTAVSWYKKSVNNNNDSDITELANKRLDKLLDRKPVTSKKKISANIIFALGNDDNVTGAAENSPSNRSDNYYELFGYVSAPISSSTNIKGIAYKLDYDTESTSDYSFYTAAVNHTIKFENWRFIPEAGFTTSTFGNLDYQDVLDFKFKARRTLDSNSSITLRYRYSDISSKNAIYDYLDGTRHQLRVDYKNKIAPGKLRLRYQLETNDRQNSTTADYSPTRHTFRARLKHKLNSKWSLSEEIGYRISTYGIASNVEREDTRLRLRLIADMKINKNWKTGIRFTYTDNDSNINNESYTRHNIQAFASWVY